MKLIRIAVAFGVAIALLVWLAAIDLTLGWWPLGR
jgi:hypothetical protein